MAFFKHLLRLGQDLEPDADDMLGGRQLSQGPFADLRGRADRADPDVRDQGCAMPRPRRTNGRSRLIVR